MSLPIQNAFLPSHSSAIVTAKSPIGADDAMTGNARVIIFIQNIPDSSKSARGTDALRNFLVRKHGAARNCSHDGKNSLPKKGNWFALLFHTSSHVLLGVPVSLFL